MQKKYFINKDTDFKKFKSYLQFPRALLSDEYKSLSSDAKFLYTLMLDRIKVSKQNNWIEEDGLIFIFYTYKAIKEDTGMSEPTISKKMKELINYELIEKKTMGKNTPDKIYLRDIITCTKKSLVTKECLVTKKTLVHALKNFKYRHLKNLSTGTKKTLVHALKKFKSNYNKYNYNKFNYNKYNYYEKNGKENLQKKFIEKIQVVVGNFLQPNAIMKLVEHHENTSQDWEVIYKAYEFVDKNKKSKNVNYVIAILNDWFTSYGVITVKDYEDMILRKNNQKNEEKEMFKGQKVEFYGDKF